MKLRQVEYVIPDDNGLLENASTRPTLQFLDDDGEWKAVPKVQKKITQEEAISLFQKGEFF